MPRAEHAEFNPLDYDNLARTCVEELMRRGPWRLEDSTATTFDGAGVYALFYEGSFAPYASLRSPDALRPIYVGKAVPPGGRKGRGRPGPNRALWGRLAEHRESITAAHSSLNTADFLVRYLVVTPLWISMAEGLLIDEFQPAWNVCLEGFGNHDPGGGRHAGEIPWWDAMHGGRPWAARLRQTRSQDHALRRLAEFLR